MILGTLRTRIIEKHTFAAAPEGGFFVIEVQLDEALMQRSGDVKGHAYKSISAHLAQAIYLTEVPVEYWTFEFSDRAARRYGFPSQVLTF